MLTNRLALLRRTARPHSRGGFTLVELLVVIGIIAILAGVALGPITNGIKKAKESAAMQQSHSIGLAMYSFANDNNQLYPDPGTSPKGIPVGNAGTGAAADAQALMAGGYVSDPTIFSLSGDTNPTFAKVSSTTNTATTITQDQISWDFIGAGGVGVSSTSYPFLPLLWSTISTGTEPAFSTATAGNPVVGTPGTASPFGMDGIAIFYINNSAAFVPSTLTAGKLQVNMVAPSNNLGGAPAAYVVNQGI